MKIAVCVARWLAATLLCAAPVAANILVPMPYEEQFRRAEFVLFGTAAGASPCTGDVARRCVRLTRLQAVKAPQGTQMPDLLEVVLSSRIAESEVNCCRKNATYLMFLLEHQGRYFPLHGAWSVLEVRPPRRRRR
jgi:hypothetical protein